MHRLIPLLLGVLAVAACASSEPGGTSTTSTSPDTTATTTTVIESTSTSMAESTTTTEATTTTAAPEIDIEITDGAAVGTGTVEVEVGETLDIMVISDVDDEIHVHGYDLTYQLEADVPQQITFLADVPGIFEVESHNSHLMIFELEVSG